MADDRARRDPNRVPSLIGVDSVSFEDTVTVAVNSSSHAMLVEISGGSIDQDVNIVSIGGNAVTTTIPVSGTVTTQLAATASMVRGNASVAGTGSTSLVAASGSGALKTYIKSVQITNTGSSTSLITFQDGSGGTTLGTTIAPAGGGSNIIFEIPIVTSANTALYFQCGTSSTTIYASAQGYTAA